MCYVCTGDLLPDDPEMDALARKLSEENFEKNKDKLEAFLIKKSLEHIANSCEISCVDGNKAINNLKERQYELARKL